MNCNKIKREGNCDAMEWVECTYCGAINNERCRMVKKEEPWNDKKRHLYDAIRKINSNESPAPYELVALVSDIMRRIDVIEKGT